MNKVKFGLRNVKYSKITTTDGVDTYATPVAIPGAVNLSLIPAGEMVEFYADDILYYTTTSNLGYTGDLEIALIPDSFLVDVLGMTTDANGALIENADSKVNSFALTFEIQGDAKARKTWLYNCTCARPNQDAATKEKGANPITDKLSITVAPRVSDRLVKLSLKPDETNETAYNGFANTVYEIVPVPVV